MRKQLEKRLERLGYYLNKRRGTHALLKKRGHKRWEVIRAKPYGVYNLRTLRHVKYFTEMLEARPRNV